MNQKIFFLLLAALTLSACAGTGERGGAPEAQTVDVRVVDSIEQTNSESDPDEVICRRTHKVGSNFPRTVCKTRRQMEEDRNEAQRAMELQRQRNASGRIDPARSGG